MLSAIKTNLFCICINFKIELNGSSKNSLPERWHFKSPHSIYESIRASYSKIDEMQSKQINDFSDLETMQSARNIPSLASLNNNIFDLKSAVRFALINPYDIKFL